MNYTRFRACSNARANEKITSKQVYSQICVFSFAFSYSLHAFVAGVRGKAQLDPHRVLKIRIFPVASIDKSNSRCHSGFGPTLRRIKNPILEIYSNPYIYLSHKLRCYTRISGVCWYSQSASLHVTRLWRHFITLMNKRQSLHDSQYKFFVGAFSNYGG